MSKIHDYHNGLLPQEKQRLEKASDSQEAIVWELMGRYPNRPFAYFEIKERYDWDKDSAKRALSNLSGSAERYKDEWDRWPLTYDKDTRKRNPKSETTCGTYRLNRDYGKPPREPEPEPQQENMFGKVKPKSRAYEI